MIMQDPPRADCINASNDQETDQNTASVSTNDSVSEAENSESSHHQNGVERMKDTNPPSDDDDVVDDDDDDDREGSEVKSKASQDRRERFYRRRLRRRVDELRRSNAETERGNRLLRDTLQRVKAFNQELLMGNPHERYMSLYLGMAALIEHQRQSNNVEHRIVPNNEEVNDTSSNATITNGGDDDSGCNPKGN